MVDLFAMNRNNSRLLCLHFQTPLPGRVPSSMIDLCFSIFYFSPLKHQLGEILHQPVDDSHIYIMATLGVVF